MQPCIGSLHYINMFLQLSHSPCWAALDPWQRWSWGLTHWPQPVRRQHSETQWDNSQLHSLSAKTESNIGLDINGFEISVNTFWSNCSRLRAENILLKCQLPFQLRFSVHVSLQQVKVLHKHCESFKTHEVINSLYSETIPSIFRTAVRLWCHYMATAL